MIPTLTEEDKNEWTSQMRRYSRRARNKAKWQLIKHLAAPILLITCCIVACGTCQQQPAKPVFNADSAYVDSLLQDHSRIPENVLSDTTETDRAYDSTVRAEYPLDSLIDRQIVFFADTVLVWDHGKWDTVLLPRTVRDRTEMPRTGYNDSIARYDTFYIRNSGQSNF